MGPILSSGQHRPAPARTRRLDWSGKRDSNPRPRAWKARALPTELFPLSRRRTQLYWWRGEDSNLRRHKPADLQSAPFGHSGTSPLGRPSAPSRWRESNSQPTDYKSVALPLSYIGKPTLKRKTYSDGSTESSLPAIEAHFLLARPPTATHAVRVGFPTPGGPRCARFRMGHAGCHPESSNTRLAAGNPTRRRC